jgi:mannose/fructose/N-acetylgalactosamine-specific phosphotransferase system component IIC
LIIQLVVTDAIAKTWHTIGMTQELPRQNRFLAMKFYEFAVISMLVLAFFPISLVVSWIAFGTQTTRELIEAMIKDWLQTMLMIVGLIIVSLGGLIWGVFAWLT